MKKKIPIYEFEWEDASFLTAFKWQSHKDALEWGKESNFIVRQCGYLLEKTKKYWLFATALSLQDKWSYTQFQGICKIPTTWLRVRKKIGVIEIEFQEE